MHTRRCGRRGGRRAAHTVVGVLGPQLLQLLEGGGRAGPAPRNGDGLSGQARMRLTRRVAENTKPGRGPGAAPPRHGDEQQDLRQAGQDSQAGESPDEERARLCFGHPTPLRRARPQWQVPRAAVGARPRKRFLSLYGGVGHCARFAAGKGHCTCLIDLCHYSDNDLSNVSVCADAESLGECADCVGIEIVCASWSLARRAPLTSTMPHRLRDHRHIWGLPGLSGRDRKLAQAGNRMLKSAIKIVCASIYRGGCGFLENPLGALLWHVIKKSFQKQISNGLCRLISTDMCAFGTRWKKPTRLLVWGSRSADICLPRCQGKHGYCSFTQQKHEQLSSTTSCSYGTTKSVFWRTRAAQEYPPDFVKSLLSQLLESS